MAVKTKNDRKIEPRPQARMSLTDSLKRTNQKYGTALAKLAK